MGHKHLFWGLLLTLLYSSGCTSTSAAEICKVREDKFGSADFTVDVTRYENPKALKSILIMPPTGGATILDRGYAKKFCADGYAVYILNSWTGSDEQSTDLELHQRLYERSTKAIQLVTDKVITPFTGILGTSVGALYLAVAVNFNKKIDAAFSILGGAPIADIIVNSDQKAMKELKEQRKRIYHLKNDEDYLAALKKSFQLEPMNLGNDYKSKIYGMILAEKDNTVPYKNQNDLKSFWAPAKSTIIPNAHFLSIIKSRFSHSDEILRFFNSAALARNKKSL